MKKHYTAIITLLGILFFFASCDYFNPDEDVPAYISIEKIKVNTTSGEGSNSHKISDAWIYIDDNILGAYELPALFPVLESGQHKITIRAGIKLNGISSTRSPYPFYEDIILQQQMLEADNILALDTLTTAYSDLAQFAWIEDFEDGGIAMEKTSRSDTGMQKSSEAGELFEGSYSGVVCLDEERDFFEVKSTNAYVLPKSNTPVFLELNYKTNNKFTIGLFINEYSQSSQQSIFVVNKSDEWNKIYISLTSIVSREVNAIDFQVFFGGFKDDGVEEARISFDNIKLIHL